MVDTRFGRWLADELTFREMSQADFARKVGASSGRVSEWLSGKRRPSPASIDKIADALPGTSVDKLLSLAGWRPPDRNPNPRDDTLEALIATFSPAQRRMLLKVLADADRVLHIGDARPERDDRRAAEERQHYKP